MFEQGLERPVGRHSDVFSGLDLTSSFFHLQLKDCLNVLSLSILFLILKCITNQLIFYASLDVGPPLRTS